MGPQVRKLYKASIKDKTFLKDIWDADRDPKPGIFSDNTTKVIFAGMYYGYLVAKYGTDWKSHI